MDDNLSINLDLDDDDEVPPHARAAPPTEGPLADPTIIVQESLAQALPCPVCGRTEPCRCLRPDGYSPTHERAALIVAALRHFGHLAPEAEPPGFDPIEVARVLADRSGFARYEGSGFVKVMQSDADVDLAAHYAMRRVATSEVEMVRAARAALLDWRKSTPPDVVAAVVAAAREDV